MTHASSVVSLARIARTVVALTAFLAACNRGGTTTAPTPVLTTIVVSLAASTIRIGQTTTASATGLDQNGASISTGALTWSSGSSSVASVSASGVVTGVAPGGTQIIATSGITTGQQSITVTP